MPDITMCEGNECPIKLSCYRYTAEPAYMQSWFTVPSYDHEENNCGAYMSRKDHHD